MNLLARLAWRNVRRNRRRTALTLLVIIAGTLALCLSGGFMAQTFQGLADAAIRGGLGHVQLMHPKALEGDEGQSLEFAIPGGEAVAARLRQDPAVLEVLPRIQIMGLISNGPKSVAFLGTAVDPEREAKHMAVLEQVRDGAKAKGGEGSRWLSADPAAREVLLGAGLARSLGAGVGASLTLMSTTKDGALNAVDVEVAGIQDFGFKELNERFLSLTLATAEVLVDAGGARSRLSVMLKDPSRAEAEAPRLAALVSGSVEGDSGQIENRKSKIGNRNIAASPWQALASFYQQVKLLYLAIFGFMGLVLFLVVLLATANTLLMSVMERLREFGTLRALGLQPGQLLALLQWEGAILGALGTFLGIVLTLLLRAAVNALHLQLPPPPGTSHGYELNIHFVPGVYLGVFLGLQLTLQLSALFPGLKAARLRIVEALRHV